MKITLDRKARIALYVAAAVVLGGEIERSYANSLWGHVLRLVLTLAIAMLLDRRTKV